MRWWSPQTAASERASCNSRPSIQDKRRGSGCDKHHTFPLVSIARWCCCFNCIQRGRTVTADQLLHKRKWEAKDCSYSSSFSLEALFHPLNSSSNIRGDLISASSFVRTLYYTHFTRGANFSSLSTGNFSSAASVSLSPLMLNICKLLKLTLNY